MRVFVFEDTDSPLRMAGMNFVFFTASTAALSKMAFPVPWRMSTLWTVPFELTMNCITATAASWSIETEGMILVLGMGSVSTEV